MISITLFVIGSMLSGLAWSAESLIFFRVLQGFGGGMIMPLGMTILTRAAGPQRVGRVMAIIGVPMLLGPIIGPILGGWLVDAASWRWIFFINLPIGIAALIARGASSPATCRSPPSASTGIGFALLSPGLALFIYGLAETSGAGGFGRGQVIVPGLIGIAMLTGFVRHGLRTELKLLSQETGFHCRSWVIWYYTFGVNCTQKFSRSHAHLFHFVKDPQKFTFRADDLENRVYSAPAARLRRHSRQPDRATAGRHVDSPSAGFAGLFHAR